VIGLLLALAGLAVVAYGFIADVGPALLAGFLIFLLGLGLHELPIRRSVRTASRNLAEYPAPAELLDFDEVDFDWYHDQQRRAA
jgi:hypothetical protein